MNAAERRFWEAAQRRAKLYEPEVRRAIMRGLLRLRNGLKSSQEIEAFLKAGAIDQAIAAFLPPRLLDNTLAQASRVARGLAVQTAESTMKLMPKGKGGLVTVQFDFLHPDTIRGIQALDTKVIQNLKVSVREGLRTTAEQGLKDGVAPRVIARRLQGIVGLAPNQVEAITNFQQLLITGDREALRRGLRDHRFDKTLEAHLGYGKAGLSDVQIGKMVTAYADRMLTFQTEVNARTAAIDALKLGHRLSWDQAISQGIVSAEELWKRWVGVMDSRERPEHVAMEGEEVPHDHEFSNGQMIPGDSEYNCRCLAFYFVRRG